MHTRLALPLLALTLLLPIVGHAANHPTGLLYFASYPQRDNPAPASNPHLIGALFTIYWSDVEKSEGLFDWSALDKRIKLWTDADKKVALRIMWSSSGNWQEPAAKHPTPQFVLDAGAVTVRSESSKTDIPLFWDPVYQKHAARFLRELARKFDGDASVLFIDVTPGAETNPYRFRRINVAEPNFKTRFMAAKASDGRNYSHELWLETVKRAVNDAASAFKTTPLLVTLNVGSLDGPEQSKIIGDHCVSRGCYVGQNGLTAKSYAKDSARKTAFQDWSTKTRFYFEMLDASGGGTGSLMDVMKAAARIGCDYLGVYAADVLHGTKGQADYDASYENALAYGAKLLGGGVTITAEATNKVEVIANPRARQDRDHPATWIMPPVEGPHLHHTTFDSKAAGEKVSCLIYLPPGYETDKARRYPVVYWLHGIGGSQQGVPGLTARLTSAIEEGKAPPFIMVFANGMIRSFYVDAVGGHQVETMIVKELIPHIDATYRTLATRETRMIEGFSMGGYGAAHLGFKDPDLFGSVSMIDGALVDLGTMQGRHAELYQSIFAGDEARFTAEHPLTLLEKNAALIKGLSTIRQVVGALVGPNETMRDQLTKLGIAHDYDAFDAGHNMGALYERLGDKNWEFYRRAFGQAESANPQVILAAAPPKAMSKEAVSKFTTKDFVLQGERWTYRDGDFEMSGILLKPEGEGPFPAVLISHGLGGAAGSFGMMKAREMVKWGMVCIAPDYTHSGRDGDNAARGASAENLRRAKTCFEIMKVMPDVDAKRVAAYGHSMGGFVTIGLAAAEPTLLKACAITGSGVAPREGFPAPSEAAADKIRTPFLMLHGANDTTVRPAQSEALKKVLDKNKVPNDRLVADGQNHPIDQTMREEVFRLIRKWFAKHGVLTAK